MAKPTPQPESLRDAARSALAGGRWRTLAELADELGGHVPVDRAKQAADRIGRTGQKVPASNVGRIAFGRRRVVMDTLNQLASRREVEADGTGDDRRFRMATANGKPRSATLPAPPRVVKMPVEDLDIIDDIQPRADGVNAAHVDDMAEWLEAHPGEDLPPVVAYRDPDAMPGETGHKPMVSDGFSRGGAYMQAGRELIPVEVREGDLRTAKLNAMASNQTHGLKRSQKDKRRAVEETLKLVTHWTDSRIGEHVGVSHLTVAAVREVMESTLLINKVEDREGSDGKTYHTSYAPSLNGHAAKANHPVSEPDPVADDPDDAPEPAPATASPPPPPAPEPPRLAAYNPPEPDEDEPSAAREAAGSGPAYAEFCRLLRAAEKLIPDMADGPAGSHLRAAEFDGRPLIEWDNASKSHRCRLLAFLRRTFGGRRVVKGCGACGGKATVHGKTCRHCNGSGVLPADLSIVGRKDVTGDLYDPKLFTSDGD